MEPITLKGERVTLAPLEAAHAEALWEAAQDTDPYRYMPTPEPIDGPDAMRRLLERSLAPADRLCFAQLVEGRVGGMTAFWQVDPYHRSLEIGSTWLTRRLQRTGVNTEAKLLMLRHAFEVLAFERVEFKTDLRNEASQRALEGIGAVREGVLRSHRRMLQGPRRDSVYYSILRDEWPAVEQRLTDRLARG